MVNKPNHMRHHGRKCGKRKVAIDIKILTTQA